MIGKLKCWWQGKHLRGKLVQATAHERIFECPRCGGNRHSRKVSAPKTPRPA